MRRLHLIIIGKKNHAAAEGGRQGPAVGSPRTGAIIRNVAKTTPVINGGKGAGFYSPATRADFFVAKELLAVSFVFTLRNPTNLRVEVCKMRRVWVALLFVVGVVL